MQGYQAYDLLRTLGFKRLFRIKKIHDHMIQFSRGYMGSSCISALFNIGFFDELEKNKSVDLETYSRDRNIDKKVLQSICDYLYSLKILRKDKNAYSMDSYGRDLFRYSRGNFELLYAYWPLFHELEALLRKDKIYGKDIFRRDRFVAKGSAGLTKNLPFPVVKDIIRKYNLKSILDLGCGSGEFLVSLCGDNDIAKCYGIDISREAIDCAKEESKKAGKEDVMALEVCSIFELDKVKEKWIDIDVLTSMFVLHEFLIQGRQKVVDLLKNIRRDFPGRYLIVCELCKKRHSLLRKKPTAVIEHHLFHALSKQELITFEEWNELFIDSGYKVSEVRRFDFAQQAYFVLR